MIYVIDYNSKRSNRLGVVTSFYDIARGDEYWLMLLLLLLLLLLYYQLTQIWSWGRGRKRERETPWNYMDQNIASLASLWHSLIPL